MAESEHFELMLILSISDPTLPPYYVINYCILITCALDDWKKAETWVLSARQVWSTTRAKARSAKHYDSLVVLDEMRWRFEELEEQQQEDLTGLTKEERDMSLENMTTDTLDDEEMYLELAEQELLEDVDGFDFEDQDEVAAVESADEIAANQLPLRPLRDHATQTSDTAQVQPPSTIAKTKSVRRKGNEDKGGAANAHTFTKSLGRSSQCPSILNMEWEQRK